MSSLRFNHVFLALLLISGVFAFVLPPRWSNLVRGRLDWAFAPVSYPVRKIAANVTGKWVDAQGTSAESRTPVEARQELDTLRTQVVNLAAQVEELEKLKNITDTAGVAGEGVRAFRVIGADIAGLDWLTLESSGEPALLVNMPVLHERMLVGRIAGGGGGGARVRLITDRGMRMDAGVYYIDPKVGLVARPTPTLLVEGIGNGAMQVVNLKLKDVEKAGVQVGDWVQLKDNLWPREVTGMLIGVIEKIEKYTRGPGYAQITIRPRVSLSQLTRVLVVTGEQKGASGSSKSMAAATPRK